MFNRAPATPTVPADLLREALATLDRVSGSMASALQSFAAAQERAADAQMARVEEDRETRLQRERLLAQVETPEAGLPEAVADSVQRMGGASLMMRSTLATYARKRLANGEKPDAVAKAIERGTDPRSL